MGQLPRFLVLANEDFNLNYQKLLRRVEEKKAIAVRATGASIERAILLCQKAVAERRIKYIGINTFSFYSQDRIPILIPGLIMEVQLSDARRPVRQVEDAQHQGKNEPKYVLKDSEMRSPRSRGT